MSKTVTILDEFKINYLTQAQYDAEVAGGTVQPDELYLTPSADYSTSEVNTGQKWIDGKAIYRKTFTVSNLSGSTSTNRVTFSNEETITGIDLLVKGEGFVQTLDGAYVGRKYYIPGVTNISATCGVQTGGGFIQEDTGIVVARFYVDNSSSHNITAIDMTYTLYYTKS